MFSASDGDWATSGTLLFFKIIIMDADQKCTHDRSTELLKGNYSFVITCVTTCLSLADVSSGGEHSLLPLGNSHPIVSYTLWVRLGINLINDRLVRLVMPTLIHRGEETYRGI